MVFVPARSKTRFIGKVREQVAGLQVTRYSATISIRTNFIKYLTSERWKVTGDCMEPVSVSILYQTICIASGIMNS